MKIKGELLIMKLYILKIYLTYIEGYSVIDQLQNCYFSFWKNADGGRYLLTWLNYSVSSSSKYSFTK
jgi:hypothetical protein